MAGNPLNFQKRPIHYGPLTIPQSTSTLFAGRTVLASGSSSVTVSTAAVNSDSIIMLTSQVGSAGVGVNSGGAIGVNSIVSGTSFAITRMTGIAVDWDDTVMWHLIQRS